MKRENYIVGVWIDDVETWHIVGAGAGDYTTLCGLDGNDSVVGQSGVIQPKRGQKIDCGHCKQIWQLIRETRLRTTDFV